MDKDFLLETYSGGYGPDAGPWNLSLESKYLEYMITKFFEENFTVGEGCDICNIGIGAGIWDRYLSYKLKNGTLTSIDRLEDCTRALEEGLAYEKNPNRVNVICGDVMLVKGLEEKFDIVTMVGSTRAESGLYSEIILKALSFLKTGGSLYYQTTDRLENAEDFLKLCGENGVFVEKWISDDTHGSKACYFKAVK